MSFLFILLSVISLLTTVLTYQLPSESKTCLLEKGIDYDSVQYDLENCVSDHMLTLSKSSTAVDGLVNTDNHELQDNIMHCVDAFESEVQDCLSYEGSNELMIVQAQAVKESERNETTANETTANETTAKSNITSCVFDIESLSPNAKNCTVKLKAELIADCKLSEKNGSLDFHWKPIESESVKGYCKAENEKSLCIVVIFSEKCADKHLMRRYREYFLCIYKTGTCKAMIESNYIQILPLASQPKRSWMTNKKSSVPAQLPELSLYLLMILVVYLTGNVQI